MNAVIYCRVSSKEQTEGTSLESQRLACKEYARTKDIKILKTFIEEGESAKFADRTQLLELLDFCRKNKGNVEALVVWKIDRFARNVTDHFSVKATLDKYGVSIVSVTEPIDTKPEGKLMETILAGFAQFDNDIRAMRTVQGMRRKIQEGIFPWAPPLGYKSPIRAGEKKTAPDEPDHPTFGLLQKAWQEFSTGAYTKAEIRRLMKAWGVTNRNGQFLTPQGVDNLFRNLYYAGILIDQWSSKEHQGLHIPMVSRELFAKVQLIVSRRSRSIPHHKHRPEFPLRGLVRCQHCHRHMTGSFSRGRSKRYAYYHCANKACGQRGRTLPVGSVHEEFQSFLASTSPSEGFEDRLGKMIVDLAAGQEARQTARRERRRTTLDSLDRQLQELIRMRSEDLITDKEFRVQRAKILGRRAATEATPADTRLEADKVRAHLAEVAAPLRNLPQTWKDLPDALRHRFQHILLPVGFVAGKIRTAQPGLLFKVLQSFSDADSIGVRPTWQSWNQICKEIVEVSKLFESSYDYEEPLL